jgi:hypothetical protein
VHGVELPTDDVRQLLSRDWYRWRGFHLVLGLLVAILAVWFAAQRATNGVRAQVDDRLTQAGAGADAALVGVESEQLAAARAIAFTHGVGRALATRNGPVLNRLVTPLQANSTVPMVDVVEPSGRVILAVRSKGAPEPVSSRHGLRALSLSLRRVHGPRGGRLTELVIFRSGPTLLTISPILDGSRPAGAVLAMTPLADVLGRLSQEVGADLTAYDANGTAIATTTTFNPTPVDSATARSLLAGAAITRRYVYADHREALGRLIVDHAPQAVLGVSLEDDSNLTGRAVGLYAALGLLATVVILAMLWARVVNGRRES